MSEPWLRGPLPDVDPVIAPLLYSFQQVREELARHTDHLSAEQIWSRPHGATPLGFHIRHIGGSAERLCTYLEGRQLSPAQLESMSRESEPGATREQLLAELESTFSRCENIARSIDLSTLRDAREVGRQRLPTTVIGLLVHIAEHTQRHLGQAITTAKLLREG